MTTSDFASPKPYHDQADWSPGLESLPASAPPSLFDPRLLNDLAEGVEFLHRQLEQSESDLATSQQQSRAFEHDARRWEQEAARLRAEAQQTRQELDYLRQEFAETSRQHHDALERLSEEMSELRTARNQQEEVTGEQQRALILSLELLRRLNAAPEPLGRFAEPAAMQELEAKEQEIAELRRWAVAASDEGARLDAELAAASAALEECEAALGAAEAEIANLKATLELTRAQCGSLRGELAGSHEALSLARETMLQAQEALSRQDERAPFSGSEPEQIMEFEVERDLLAQRLQDADAEIALQNSEVESRGAIIIALENALEEQNTSLRTLEERFLAYAEQVQALQLRRLERPINAARGVVSKFARIFSPPKRSGEI